MLSRSGVLPKRSTPLAKAALPSERSATALSNTERVERLPCWGVQVKCVISCRITACAPRDATTDDVPHEQSKTNARFGANLDANAPRGSRCSASASSLGGCPHRFPGSANGPKGPFRNGMVPLWAICHPEIRRTVARQCFTVASNSAVKRVALRNPRSIPQFAAQLSAASALLGGRGHRAWFAPRTFDEIPAYALPTPPSGRDSRRFGPRRRVFWVDQFHDG